VKGKHTLICAAIAAAGCAAALPAPNALDAQRIASRYPHATVADLELGRSLYAKRCSSCHQLFEPARFSGSRWQEELGQMRDRAGLKGDEERLILQYLSAVGERPSTAPGTASGSPGAAL
jgi:mono/diheme cytochrome c family protein